MKTLILFGLALTLLGRPLHAQDPRLGPGETNPTVTDTQQVAGDEARDISDRPNEKTRENTQEPKAPNASNKRVTFALGNHPSLSVGSALKLEFDARIESDVRLATRAIGLDTAQVDWQQPRVGVTGSLWKTIRFELSRDPSEGDTRSPWKDAYVDLRATKAFEVKAGRFKVPFGREMLTGRTNLDFVYRSLAATELSPGRDVGLMTHGRLWGQGLEYQAGYFARDGDHARTSQTSGARQTLAGRVVVAPFAWTSIRALASLAIGVAAAGSHLDNQLGLRGVSVFGDGVFFDRVYVNGRRERIGLEGSWARGPVSISSEYIVVVDERKSMGFAEEDLPSVRTHGWYVAGTWALTGEAKRGRLKPHRALLQGGWGAVEVAVRIEQLGFDGLTYPGTSYGFPAPSKLLSNADLVTTLGINWYLNRYMKVQPNLVIESIGDSERSPAPATGRFVSGVFRVQFGL